MHLLIKLGLYSGVVLGLIACGGSGGGSSQSTSSSTDSKTGTFIDSPVMGLSYSSPSHSGLTNSAGEFTYTEGETVSFSLGGIALGSSIASEVVTPLDLLGAESIDDAISSGLFDQLINMLVFLQSLDRDHNPNNGIDLGDLDTALANEELVFDLDQDLFLNTVYKRIVNENAGVYVTADAAKKHFADSLGVTYTVALPSKDYLDTDGDSNNDIVISYVYDDSGKLIEIFEAPSGIGDLPAIKKTTIQYDNEGRISLLTYDDIENEILLFTREYNYDLMGRLASLVEYGSDNILLLQESWQYDDVGNELEHLYWITSDGVSPFQPNKNPFDLFYNIKAYNPHSNIQVPFTSYFERSSPFSFQNVLEGEVLKTYTYEDDGNWASESYSYTINYNFSSSFIVNSQNELIFESGRKLSSNGEASIENNPFSSQANIIYGYTEDGLQASCTFTSIQNDTPTEIFVSFEPESDLVFYSCGDLGFDETIVFRDEAGNIQTVFYNLYGSSSFTDRREQTIVYENNQLVGVLNQSLVDQGGFITTTMSSTQYEYTDLGNLSFIEESSNDPKIWTREYELIEVR